MAVSHRTVISFGLVAIPVALYTATQDNDISFNQLHKEDNSRVRYKKVCAHCGKEVDAKSIVKGYEYDKDKYVIITDDDIENIKTEKDRSVRILHFATLDQISPVYYNKAYHIVPEAGGEKALELLRRAMMDTQRVAIGKAVLGTSESMLVLIPREDGMLLQTMMYAEEIKEIPKAVPHPDVSDAEVKMAKQLISAMDAPFVPEQYVDEYQQKLRELIQAKIAGQEVVTDKSETPNNIINLMDALKASIDQTKPKRKPRKKAQ